MTATRSAPLLLAVIVATYIGLSAPAIPSARAWPISPHEPSASQTGGQDENELEGSSLPRSDRSNEGSSNVSLSSRDGWIGIPIPMLPLRSMARSAAEQDRGGAYGKPARMLFDDRPGFFESQHEVMEVLAFLTGPILFTDHSAKSVTAGGQLPLSYFSTPRYWAEYVCDPIASPGNRCDYTIRPRMDGGHWQQLPDPLHDIAGRLAIERADVTAGSNIYDAAVWQTALALAQMRGPSDLDRREIQGFIENQNRHLTDPKYRATDSTFRYYSCGSIADASESFYFRMTPIDYLNADPLWTGGYRHFITNAPEVDVDLQGQTTWTDWKPITGENAWAFLLGPMHADTMLYAERGYIPFTSRSIQNALGVLPAFACMQSSIGAFYYAPLGSEGNEGPVSPGEISVENNASVLAGMRVLQDALRETSAQDPDADTVAIKRALKMIFVMLHGGAFENGRSTSGLLSFLYKHAFDPSLGHFLTAGISDPQVNPTTFRPKPQPNYLAVDANTWAVSALGPGTVDAWWGPGTALQVWQRVRSWGGYFGSDGVSSGPIRGVGYSDHDDHKVMSAEWTAGAIDLLRMLDRYYTDNPDVINAADLAALRADEKSMLNGLKEMRTDKYRDAGFNDSLPPEFMSDPPIGLALLYSSKRYYIPFGWYANPLPSTTSTAWSLLLHYDYHPLQPGGSAVADVLPRPLFLPFAGQGP